MNYVTYIIGNICNIPIYEYKTCTKEEFVIVQKKIINVYVKFLIFKSDHLIEEHMLIAMYIRKTILTIMYIRKTILTIKRKNRC